jgi:Tfp pilus assembly protein FimV
MALDLRRSNRRSCRTWLERVLLSLEREGVLDANYERRPPHYHVAVFPQPYQRYVQRLATQGESPPEAYRVRRGDTLWKIARQTGASVEELRVENGLRSDRLSPGQVLRVPETR